jgi:aminopeptidase YwaD
MRVCRLLLLLLLPYSAFTQDMVRVKQNLFTLCSPEFSGRGYVNDGDKKAANLIQQQFRQAGLQPFSSNYYQTFSLPVNTVQEVKLKIGNCKLKPGRDFIPDAGIGPGKGKLRVLPLDTLIFTDEARGEKFLETNLRGKALLMPERFWAKRNILPAIFAQRMQSASALLITQPGKLTYTVAIEQQAQPRFEVLQKRVAKTPNKVKFEAEAKFIPSYQTQNVIGYIPGSVYPDSFIVFSAHYDHLGSIGKKTYFPGANDNASGTSLLLELAHHYGKAENRPKYSVAFMAFGAEEAGLWGSKHYVENPLFPLRQIKFLLNLDLTGTGEAGLMVVNGRVHEKAFARLKSISDEKRYFPEVKARGKAANSDHFPFSEKGVPAFFCYTLGGTAAYHDINDKPETLPLTRFSELFRLLLDFTRGL